PGLRFGISASWASGDLDNNDNLTTVDLDTAGVGVYGSYSLPNGVFFDANVSYATTDSDYTVNAVGGGVVKGSYDVNSWQFGARGGAVVKVDNFQIIPSVGVRVLSLEQKGWTETLDAAALANPSVPGPHVYGKTSDHQVDIPLQVKFNATVAAGSATVTPELRLGYTFTVKKPDNVLNVGFVGAPQTWRIQGVKPRSGSFQIGAGVKVNTGGLVDIFANYDLDASSGYKAHNASLGIGFEF
ncbi:MAG: autotransporter outer membrane beta-barrel domain-containing protein, partial [Deltaproteobacteria bacterium]|nr:autotransporter outer membrane beta-barrel domain-containing protein [Deltaproteobacteria bacterium]